MKRYFWMLCTLITGLVVAAMPALAQTPAETAAGGGNHHWIWITSPWKSW